MPCPTLGIPLEDLVGRTVPATERDSGPSAVKRAIRQERRLSTAQKEALISLFRGFLESGTLPASSSEPE